MPSFLDVVTHTAPDRRHSSEYSRPAASLSRNGSTSSLNSHKSEPGWMTSMNGVDRSRASSIPTQPSTKPSSGLGRLFGKGKGDKPKKEKKDVNQMVLTSRHAAAVKTKLALDPKYQHVVHKESNSAPILSSTQNSLLIPAAQQEMRHPHSGPPAIYAPADKAELPVLTRIISGDEADEQDEWERMRQEWKQRQAPGVAMLQVIEGETMGGDQSGNTSPQKEERIKMEVSTPKIIDREGTRLLSVVDISLNGEEYQPRPERHHTPIGGRWKKDENGVWKR